MEVDYDSLYKKLVVRDNLLRKMYRSVGEGYIQSCLEEDIVSNAISILVNREFDNWKSQGVYINARTIIETLSLCVMISKKKITKDELDCFNDQSFFVEYKSNKIMKTHSSESVLQEDKVKYEELIEKYSKAKNAKKEEIKIFSKSPLFYLSDRKEITRNGFVNPDTIVKKYFPKMHTIYQILGVLIHPHFFSSATEKISLEINPYIDTILQCVDSLMSIAGIKTDTNNICSLKEKFECNPFVDNKKLVQNISRTIDKINVKCNKTKSSQNFNVFFLDGIKSLYLDMQYNSILGYTEQGLAKYKSLLELVAVGDYINHLPQNDYQRTILAFYASSGYSIMRNFRKLGIKSDFDFERQINEAYPENSDQNKEMKKEYQKNIKMNSLYYLTGNKKMTYQKLVKDFLMKSSMKEETKSIYKTFYDLSLDYGHTGGYLLNSSQNIWDKGQNIPLQFTHDYFKIFSLNLLISRNSSEMNNTSDKLFIELCFDLKKEEDLWRVPPSYTY